MNARVETVADYIFTNTMDKADSKEVFIPTVKTLLTDIYDLLEKDKVFESLKVVHTLTDLLDLYTSCEIVEKNIAKSRVKDSDSRRLWIGRYLEHLITFI